MNWFCKKFSELSVAELYDILKLRSEVFVVEQQCIYLDMDGKDEDAHHLFTYHENVLAAYCRLLAPGISYKDESSIGRVLTSPNTRRNGYGIELMKTAIDKIKNLYPHHHIKIGAQVYLQKFYEGFGFVQTSDMFLEDGIPHIDMHLAK